MTCQRAYSSPRKWSQEKVNISYVLPSIISARNVLCTMSFCITEGIFGDGNSDRTSELSDNNAQTSAGTETKIVKVSDDPPLVNGQNGEYITTSLRNVHELIRPTMKLIPR